MTRDPAALVDAAVDGDRPALARLISLIEAGGESATDALALLHPHTGSAFVLGVTGAPGAGKSTLVDRLLTVARAAGDVAVVAVDPSSPFTGGAILGDRVRMQDHVGDEGVFIRSMASRGHLGGIAAATPKAVTTLDAAGFPLVIIETVGVGQAEVEVAGSADTTVVVVNPRWGDSIQAAKAGLLETGDIFVVNKADLPGADEAVADLVQMLAMGATSDWTPPVVKTVATEGEGVTELWEAIGRHRSHLEITGRMSEIRLERLRRQFHEAMVTEARDRASGAQGEDRFRELESDVVAGKLDPWTAAVRFLDA
jgi:LAO/AO transport system kinase